MQIHLDKVRPLVTIYATARRERNMNIRRALTVIAIAESSARNRIRDAIRCNYIV